MAAARSPLRGRRGDEFGNFGGRAAIGLGVFTERASPKRQHHYINCRDLAASTGWTYAAIDYATTGGAETPLGLFVRFADGQGKPVTINVDFAPGAHLSHLGAGLTDQTGHSADRLFLLFHRESTARTEQSAVTIDGIEVSEPRANEPPPPFRAAYSRNIFVGTIPFGESRVSFGAGIAGELNFREQQSADTARRLYVATRARRPNRTARRCSGADRALC